MSRYDRQEILSLRLRSKVNLKRLSRKELFSRLQLSRTLEPLISKTYERALRQSWRDQENDSPHGHPWHVSFHASSFPGDDPFACPRKALYTMMDVPSDGPPSRRLHLTAETGKALEVDLVSTMAKSGKLISATPDAEVQTGFEIPECMLTGTVDMALELRKRATPVEIKTKFIGDIEDMRSGKRGPDSKHVKQLKTQLGLARAAQESGELWSDLKLCDGGYIYYMPRDSKYDPRYPIQTAEFWVQYDAVFFETGLQVLRQWKEWWEDDILPELLPGKRESKFGHPNGWKWSKESCQFCNFKKTCRADFVAGVSELSKSKAIESAKLVRPEYSYENARRRVEKRWSSTP